MAEEPQPRRVSTPPGGPRSSQTPEVAPLSARLAEACVLAFGCSLVGSIPAALRVSQQGGSFVGGWFGSAATVLPLLLAFILLSRAAGRGYRMLTGNRAGRPTASAIAAWVGLSTPLLVILGTALKAGTNHRGIGGATFGVMALVSTILCALVARRLVTAAQSLSRRGAQPRTIAVGFAVITLGPLLLTSYWLLHGKAEDTLDTRAVIATLVDGAIFVVAAALAASLDMSEELRVRTRLLGPVLALGLFGTGLALMITSVSLTGAIRSGGGLAATLIGTAAPNRGDRG